MGGLDPYHQRRGLKLITGLLLLLLPFWRERDKNNSFTTVLWCGMDVAREKRVAKRAKQTFECLVPGQQGEQEVRIGWVALGADHTGHARRPRATTDGDDDDGWCRPLFEKAQQLPRQLRLALILGAGHAPSLAAQPVARRQGTCQRLHLRRIWRTIYSGGAAAEWVSAAAVVLKDFSESPF
ncbi:hypothetical protein CDAR_11561 [Caerostris darwini]|uniref:Uncharacterized protein n=1 Tax=Caerostris darwini TaxID=1538125 RepID=A0AAV4RA99_9ARAC|nr:hypothetical protein CDAR_11561 [Caerostris darwini]